MEKGIYSPDYYYAFWANYEQCVLDLFQSDSY